MFDASTILLANGNKVAIRLLEQGDAERLHSYLNKLSSESRSRFGPHPFDKETIYNICNNPDNNIQRFIALYKEKIVAYMLLKKGMIAEDAERYARYNMQFYDDTLTYAPSVADEFQNTGLGSKMFNYILEILKPAGYKKIVLWGGVQATNTRAVHFYEKHGFTRIANFWHNDKDNIDMVLSI